MEALIILDNVDVIRVQAKPGHIEEIVSWFGHRVEEVLWSDKYCMECQQRLPPVGGCQCENEE